MSVKSSARFHEMESRKANNAQSLARVIAGFSMVDWHGEKTWSGFGTSTWLIQQKFAMRTVGKSANFLKAEEKRIFLFSHFMFYSSVSEFQ